MTDDALVRFLAEKCHGWTEKPTSMGDQWVDETGLCHGCVPLMHWNPLTSDADAFGLLRSMAEKGFEIEMFGDDEYWTCNVISSGRLLANEPNPDPLRAICVACYRALGGEE